MRPMFEIGGERIEPGTRRLVDIPVSKLSNHVPVSLAVHVIHGSEPGPTLFVSAAVHGDEINGVEIIRRLLRIEELSRLKGTLLCIPVVNAYGFIARSRYLPDARDLNRSFPGNATGPLASRLAHILMQEVVSRSSLGIDLHTAAANRTNLPQIRSALKTDMEREIAQAFGAPVTLTAPERDGSLREAARRLGIPVVVYEGGEGLRFDEFAIRVGVRGILGVMQRTGMVELPHEANGTQPPIEATSSSWLRAPEGGVLLAYKTTGDTVEPGEVIGAIANPYEDVETEIRAPKHGMIIGRTRLPVVNLGDALFHVAWVKATEALGAQRSTLSGEVGTDPLFDEDEIV
ncbi:MAG: succinylglutamate desuccinylase/aspartoacylase family protein [Hyphomicrobiaceae bacterium]